MVWWLGGRRYLQGMESKSDYSWMDRVPLMHGPWDEAGWSCCDDSNCPFVAKCRNTERMDAAFLQWRAEQEVPAEEH
jgi:hypothetical protein